MTQYTDWLLDNRREDTPEALREYLEETDLLFRQDSEEDKQKIVRFVSAIRFRKGGE